LITLIIDAHARVSPRRRQHRERPLSRVPSGTGAVSTQPSFARSISRLSTAADAGHRADPPSREPARSKRTFSSR